MRGSSVKISLDWCGVSAGCRAGTIYDALRITLLDEHSVKGT